VGKIKRTNDKINKKNSKENNKGKTQKGRKRNKKKIRLKIILTATFLIFFFLVGLFLFRWGQNGWGWQGFLMTIFGHSSSTVYDLGRVNVLIIGSDDGDQADTVLLASYDPRMQEIAMLSIPRDTFIGEDINRAAPRDRINSVGKNPEAIMAAVEEITGLEIHFYVSIEIDAFIELVDEIGGVDFYVPIDMNYYDPCQDLLIDLRAGQQRLNGAQAEQLVRFRNSNTGVTFDYEYGTYDYGRMRTGRDFILATMQQTLRPENILRIRGILDVMYGRVTTNVSLATARDYIPYVINFNDLTILSNQLPGESKIPNGSWVFIHDPEETAIMVREMFFTFEDRETVEDS